MPLGQTWSLLPSHWSGDIHLELPRGSPPSPVKSFSVYASDLQATAANSSDFHCFLFLNANISRSISSNMTFEALLAWLIAGLKQCVRNWFTSHPCVSKQWSTSRWPLMAVTERGGEWSGLAPRSTRYWTIPNWLLIATSYNYAFDAVSLQLWYWGLSCWLLSHRPSTRILIITRLPRPAAADNVSSAISMEGDDFPRSIIN